MQQIVLLCRCCHVRACRSSVGRGNETTTARSYHACPAHCQLVLHTRWCRLFSPATLISMHSGYPPPRALCMCDRAQPAVLQPTLTLYSSHPPAFSLPVQPLLVQLRTVPSARRPPSSVVSSLALKKSTFFTSWQKHSCSNRYNESNSRRRALLRWPAGSSSSSSSRTAAGEG